MEKVEVLCKDCVNHIGSGDMWYDHYCSVDPIEYVDCVSGEKSMCFNHCKKNNSNLNCRHFIPKDKNASNSK